MASTSTTLQQMPPDHLLGKQEAPLDSDAATSAEQQPTVAAATSTVEQVTEQVTEQVAEPPNNDTTHVPQEPTAARYGHTQKVHHYPGHRQPSPQMYPTAHSHPPPPVTFYQSPVMPTSGHYPMDLHSSQYPQQYSPYHEEWFYSLASLKQQVEFYFSYENLSNDNYLVQQLIAHKGMVPCYVVGSFPRVVNIVGGYPASPHLLGRALNASTVVRVYGHYLFPLNNALHLVLHMRTLKSHPTLRKQHSMNSGATSLTEETIHSNASSVDNDAVSSYPEKLVVAEEAKEEMPLKQVQEPPRAALLESNKKEEDKSPDLASILTRGKVRQESEVPLGYTVNAAVKRPHMRQPPPPPQSLHPRPSLSSSSSSHKKKNHSHSKHKNHHHGNNNNNSKKTNSTQDVSHEQARKHSTSNSKSSEPTVSGPKNSKSTGSLPRSRPHYSKSRGRKESHPYSTTNKGSLTKAMQSLTIDDDKVDHKKDGVK